MPVTVSGPAPKVLCRSRRRSSSTGGWADPPVTSGEPAKAFSAILSPHSLGRPSGGNWRRSPFSFQSTVQNACAVRINRGCARPSRCSDRSGATRGSGEQNLVPRGCEEELSTGTDGGDLVGSPLRTCCVTVLHVFHQPLGRHHVGRGVQQDREPDGEGAQVEHQ